MIKLVLGIIRSVLFGAGYYCSYKWIKCHIFAKTPMTPGSSVVIQPCSKRWRCFQGYPWCCKIGAGRLR